MKEFTSKNINIKMQGNKNPNKIKTAIIGLHKVQ